MTMANKRTHRNPFAGYKDFGSCVRAQSRKPGIYSPGGYCAAIERRAKPNPGHPGDNDAGWILLGIGIATIWLMS
jgi:hypothetical protein